jgi:hypothetical protein
MLFGLQNIDPPGLIWKIFRNKELEAGNQPESEAVDYGKCWRSGYCLMAENFFDSLKISAAG